MTRLAYDSAEAARMYDLDTTQQVTRDIPVYLGYASRSSGAVLELGCGTGRVLKALARYGLTMVGLDNHVHMLHRCMETLRLEHPKLQDRVQLVCADMRGIPLNRPFASILLPLRTIQHLLTAADRYRVLRQAYGLLEPGGTLMVSFVLPSRHVLETPVDDAPVPDYSFVDPDTGRRIVRSSQYVAKDPGNRILEYTLFYAVEDERIALQYRLAYFDAGELVEQAMDAGFQTIAIHDFPVMDRADGGADYFLAARK